MARSRATLIDEVEEKIALWGEDQKLYIRERISEASYKLGRDTLDPDTSISSYLEALSVYLNKNDTEGIITNRLEEFHNRKAPKLDDENEELIKILRAYAKYWGKNDELQEGSKVRVSSN